ncbi:MAG: glycosyltransferase protein [Rhizobium sp.]|nr:glycosyltransferase protein [Rhizobium sp.]
MLLSVLMPSNRNLANSRRAIETALAFCEKRDALLIVSDNSRDPEKRAALSNVSPRLRYIQPPDDTPHTNLLTVLAAAETAFVLMMGDDDELFVSPKDIPLDLAALEPDCIGVRPLVAVASSAGRVMRVKDFALLDETPGARVMTYNSHAKGDNAAYYSIFRRQPYIDLLRFFLTHHPLKAGFSDWALTCVLFSYGRLPYDPGIIFKYNFHQWDDAGKLEEQTRSSFAAVGLPETAERFKLLLLYLDILILALRKGSPLDQAGKRDLAEHAGGPILAGFLKKVAAEPQSYGKDASALAERIWREPDASRQFDLALDMADCIQPGLAARFRAFHRIAMKG